MCGAAIPRAECRNGSISTDFVWPHDVRSRSESDRNSNLPAGRQVPHLRHATLPHIAADIKMVLGNLRLVASVIFASIGILTSGTLSRSQSIDVQEKCASQAQMSYQESEREGREHSTRLGAFFTGSSKYRSHYNTRLQKCLMLIDQTQTLGNRVSAGATLTDADARHVYAIYIWISRENKNHSEVPPIVCELIPPESDRRNCTSRNEFDAFVAVYMDE